MWLVCVPVVTSAMVIVFRCVTVATSRPLVNHQETSDGIHQCYKVRQRTRDKSLQLMKVLGRFRAPSHSLCLLHQPRNYTPKVHSECISGLSKFLSSKVSPLLPAVLLLASSVVICSRSCFLWPTPLHLWQ